MSFAVLLNDTRADKHHGCTAVMNASSELARKHGIERMATVPSRTDWRTCGATRAKLEAADLIMVNGEGTIHHDRPAGRLLLEISQWARDARKPCALINTTWAENGAELVDLARGFDLISVRESESKAELNQQGVDCRVVPDLALWHHGPAAQARSGIRVSDSVLAGASVRLHHNLARLGARPISLLYGRRTPLEAARNLRRYQLDPDARAQGWRRIIPTAMADWSAQMTDQGSFLEALASAELVVTGRFHALILCLATRTPVLVVPSNTHKNEATLADTGLETWRLPPDITQIDAALLERARQWTDAEATRLDHWLSSSRKVQDTLFADLAALIRR